MGNNPSAANRLAKYCKPLTISPGLIYFRKRFLMDLYKGGGGGGGGACIRGWANTWMIFCVSIKQVRHKQVSHKQENKDDNML
jgi:hypothetical protein